MGVLTCYFFCCKPEIYTRIQNLPAYHNRKSPKFDAKSKKVIWTTFSVYKGWNTQHIPLRSFNVKKQTKKKTLIPTPNAVKLEQKTHNDPTIQSNEPQPQKDSDCPQRCGIWVSSSSFVTQSFLVTDTNSKCEHLILNFTQTHLYLPQTQ